jgi:ribosomal subunit interface protein
MFKFQIHGENIEVTDAIKASVQEKLSVLEKYTDKPVTVTVNVRTYPNGEAKAEATLPLKKTLHAEDRSRDLYDSIDKVVEKLDRQARRLKTQKLKHEQDHTALKDLFRQDYK